MISSALTIISLSGVYQLSSGDTLSSCYDYLQSSAYSSHGSGYYLVDIDGSGGEITDIFTMQNNIYIHTEKGLWHQPQSYQERITGDVVSFLGTGDYFAIPSRKIIDADSGYSAGINIKDKWATVKTPYGVFFLSRSEGKYYQFDGQNLKSTTDKVMNFKFREQLINANNVIAVSNSHDQIMGQVDANMRNRPRPPPMMNTPSQPDQQQSFMPVHNQEFSSNYDAQTAMRVSNSIDSKSVGDVRNCRPFLNAEIHQGLALRKTSSRNDRSAPRL